MAWQDDEQRVHPLLLLLLLLLAVGTD